jgi:hypothetical protein
LRCRSLIVNSLTTEAPPGREALARETAAVVGKQFNVRQLEHVQVSLPTVHVAGSIGVVTNCL